MENMLMDDSVIIIIDMQNDYCDINGYYAKRDGRDFEMNTVAERIVPFYEKMKKLNRKVVCFSISYQDGDNPCIKGTWGQAYYKIKPEIHFTKTEFSCFSNKDFCKWLDENNIKKIFLCGFQMTFCVKATYEDAQKRGYEVFLLEDLIGERKKHYEKASFMLKDISENGNIIVQSFSLYEGGETYDG